MRGHLRRVKPRLNHGRWILDCPDCASALLVELVGDVFTCAECFDPEAGRGLAVVDRDATLEAAVWVRVSHRPVENRNWSGEALSMLEAENRLRGYPSEAGALVMVPGDLPVERT